MGNSLSFDRLGQIVGPALLETIFMVFFTCIFSMTFGMILAILLYMTDDRGLKPNKTLNRVLGFFVNVFRSFPFIILSVSIIPITRIIVGTAIGNVAALVPLIISSTAFSTRIFENALREVDYELVEAVKSFGSTDFQVLKDVIFVEARPALVSGLSVIIIAALNQSAVAGAVGAGGLGSAAIMYGYQVFDDIVMYGIVIILIILVQIIQMSGNYLYKIVKK